MNFNDDVKSGSERLITKFIILKNPKSAKQSGMKSTSEFLSESFTNWLYFIDTCIPLMNIEFVASNILQIRVTIPELMKIKQEIKNSPFLLKRKWKDIDIERPTFY